VRLVLLGAGASVDAGLPTTADLTRLLDDQVALRQQRPLLDAFRYVVGGLTWGASRSGGSPFEPPDVESVMAAVRMLGSRSALEVAPFVSWEPTLERLEAPQPEAFLESRVERAVERMLSERQRVGRSFFGSRDLTEAIRSAAGAGRPFPAFEELEQQLLGCLAQVLWLKESAPVAYLAPLLDRRRVSAIATLNYDNSVELCAAASGLAVSTGVRTGFTDQPLEFESDAMNLIKLHGSLNWYMEHRPVGDFIRDHLHVVAEPGAGPPIARLEPALIFGAGAKLRADGPFLALFRDFQMRLAVTQELVAVGYSFRDPHINHVVEQWLLAADDRRLLVVNPAPLEPEAWGRSFPARLTRAVGRNTDRVAHLQLKASDGIAQLP
jgi:hypothetical protein